MVVFGVTGGEDDGDRTRGAAGREPDALAGGGIQPLDVVDDQQDRPLTGRDLQQSDRPDAHRRPVARRWWPERERRRKRGSLWRWELCQSVQHGGEQIR